MQTQPSHYENHLATNTLIEYLDSIERSLPDSLSPIASRALCVVVLAPAALADSLLHFNSFATKAVILVGKKTISWITCGVGGNFYKEVNLTCLGAHLKKMALLIALAFASLSSLLTSALAASLLFYSLSRVAVISLLGGSLLGLFLLPDRGNQSLGILASTALVCAVAVSSLPLFQMAAVGTSCFLATTAALHLHAPSSLRTFCLSHQLAFAPPPPKKSPPPTLWEKVKRPIQARLGKISRLMKQALPFRT